MFQPLLDLIQSFITEISRIADALELIAKSTYYKEDVAIREKEVREAKKKEEELRRKGILEQLIARKIPYSAEMSTDQLEKRLEHKAEPEAKEEPEVKEEPKAKSKSKNKTKAKEEPEVKAEPEVKEEPKATISDEQMREACVELCNQKSSPWLVDFFTNYTFKTPAVRISAIAQGERQKFLDDAKAEASK